MFASRATLTHRCRLRLRLRLRYCYHRYHSAFMPHPVLHRCFHHTGTSIAVAMTATTASSTLLPPHCHFHTTSHNTWKASKTLTSSPIFTHHHLHDPCSASSLKQDLYRSIITPHPSSLVTAASTDSPRRFKSPPPESELLSISPLLPNYYLLTCIHTYIYL